MVFIPADAPDILLIGEKTNINEARIVAALDSDHRMTSGTFDAYKTVGVIVPYRNQIAMIRREIARKGIPELAHISIDTVERYQGSQRDVIIYSFTIQNFSQLNFLTANTFQEDEYVIDRKLNVAITRARKQLFLTGNPQILGANITFYKLMEYIRMNNGYIQTDTDAFCRGDFTLPEYMPGWDLQSENYPLSEAFDHAFRHIVEENSKINKDEARNRELTAYGRCDFRNGTNAVSAYEQIQLYNCYYMRRAYSAARALFESNGGWLFSAVRNLSGRVPAESVFRQEEGELRPVRNGLSFAGFLAARGAERLFRIDQFRVDRMAPGVVGRLCRVRDFLMERALRGVTSDRVRGCAAALFFGATGGIDSSIRERFVRSGTIHLFSVSGMHVAVLAGVLLWLLRPLPLRPRMLSLLLLVGAYVLTTGANPPAVRALCMIGVWCLLRMVLLYTPALNTLFLAAAAMVLVSPMLVLDLGFQYSFVITAMLILLAERFREWNELLREPLRYMPTGRAAFRFERSLRRGSALLFAVGGCVGAFLAGAGISLYSQGLLLPGSVLANLLLSPLVGALFPVLAFKLAFGALLPGLDQLGAWLLTAGFSLMDAVAGTVSTCFGRMSAVRPAAWEAVLFTGALLVAAGVRKRRIAVAAAFLAAILLAGWVVRAEIRPPSLMTGAGGRSPLPVVAVAEPGRGVGVAINMPGSDAAEAVAGFFRSNGITEVETLYLSRPRTGAVLGVPALLRAMPVRRIALPPRDSYGWRMEELLELRAAGVPVSRHAGRDPGFCRILDEKTHWEVEYFNPGSKLIFRLWIDAADSGWCFTLRRPGRPEERFLIPYGSVLEMREHVFEGF